MAHQGIELFDEKEERAILTSSEDDGPNGAPVIPSLSVSKKPLLRDIHPFTAASNHSKKVYPKLFEIDDTNTITKYGFIKAFLFFVVAAYSNSTSGLSSGIIPCNEQTMARMGTLCLQANSTFTCVDDNNLAAHTQCSFPNLAKIPSAGSQTNPSVVICLTMPEFNVQCIDPTSCTQTARTLVTSSLMMVMLCAILQLVLEIVHAVLLAKFLEYTADDYASGDGYVQLISIGAVKTIPTISSYVHVVSGLLTLFFGSQTLAQGASCSTAITTAGGVSSFFSHCLLFLIALLIFWVFLLIFGFKIRSRYMPNPLLFSPSIEVPHNEPIDFDCAWARTKKDPNETSIFRRCMQSCIFEISRCCINCGGHLYYLISNRKNLGP